MRAILVGRREKMGAKTKVELTKIEFSLIVMWR